MSEPVKRGKDRWVLVLAGLALVGLGLALWVVWWKLAKGRGAESIHRRAEIDLKDTRFAGFLGEFRYPDMFILRVTAEDGVELDLPEFDRLLASGSKRTESSEGGVRQVLY